MDCGNKHPLEFKKCLCLSAKFGKVDRGLRPRGSLSESRADEEQPVGGEGKVHPSLEEPTHSTMTFQLRLR